MTSPTASELARERFAREMRGDTSVVAAVAAAELVSARLLGGLARWFGPYGAQALATRALLSVQGRHPILAGVTITDTNRLAGLSGSVPHDAHAIIEAIVAMIAALGQTLGRLIGDDLALSLLEQCTTSSAVGPSDAPGDLRSDAVTKRPTIS